MSRQQRSSVDNLHDQTAHGTPPTVKPSSDPPSSAILSVPLGSLEAEIMEILWRHNGWLTAPEVHQQLNERRDLAYTTVSTVLIRLWNKGLLERQREGRAQAYCALMSREQFAAARMAEVLGRIEDRPGVLTRFVDALPASERAQLRRMLSFEPRRER